MNFSEALIVLKQGKRIIRSETKKLYDQLWLHYDICAYTGEKEIMSMNKPWEPTAEQLKEDLLADDWEVID